MCQHGAMGMSLLYLVAIVALAGFAIWLFSALFEWVLFKRIIRDRSLANIASVLASWATFMLVSINSDPLIMAGYTVAAAILIALSFFAGRGGDGDAKDAIAETFE